MTFKSIQEEVNDILMQHGSLDSLQKEKIIDHYRQIVQSYVKIEQSVAVFTNYQDNYSYIYSGAFGTVFDLKSDSIFINSAFEDDIFSRIHPDDLLERNILELRYFHYLMTLSPNDRCKYNTYCHIRARNRDNEYIYITHRTYFLTSLSDGVIWLSLCVYTPCIEQNMRQGIDGKIVNNENGNVLPIAQYIQCDQFILTDRETEILKEIALGKGSKEIASALFISPFTVYRHRQNLIRKLQVTNSAEAVKTALLMGLIKI